MKKLALALVAVVVIAIPTTSHAGYVNGYYKSNGTYVNGYYRTEADGIPYNNYSYPGNYNPNTGSITGGDPATYLENYYKNSSSGSTYSYPTISYPSTPSCPSNSYASGSSCTCYAGYAASGSSCVTGSSYCLDQYGVNAQYDYLGSTCGCKPGYTLDGSSCVAQSSTSYNCPVNSHLSSIDNKCYCDTGYHINSGLNGCDANVLGASTSRSGLTTQQIDSIIALLQSFGADPSVISNVRLSLGG